MSTRIGSIAVVVVFAVLLFASPAMEQTHGQVPVVPNPYQWAAPVPAVPSPAPLTSGSPVVPYWYWRTHNWSPYGYVPDGWPTNPYWYGTRSALQNPYAAGYYQTQERYRQGQSQPTYTSDAQQETRSTIHVIVPTPTAHVALDGVEIHGTGGERTLVTPIQRPGAMHDYDVSASWTDLGQVREAMRTVALKAGQSATVDFRKLPWKSSSPPADDQGAAAAGDQKTDGKVDPLPEGSKLR